jgi:hypothetical protein
MHHSRKTLNLFTISLAIKLMTERETKTFFALLFAHSQRWLTHGVGGMQRTWRRGHLTP